MNHWNMLAFVVFPYLSLTAFVVGHLFRYATDPQHWNAKSSELLEKDSLKLASNLFHYGVIFTFVGHFVGLLIPQAVYDVLGIDGETHTRIAVVLGAVLGSAALLGSFLLLHRRITKRRIVLNSSPGDIITSVLLFLVVGAGTYNVFFGHYYVLDTVAPWIRSIVTFAPDPNLMTAVPFSYKLHILGAFALFGLSPFSRLIHIWSVPVAYPFRSFILLRRRGVRL